jgi:hypothetical protein
MIIADIVTTLIQVAGAALLGTAESNLYQGKDVALTPDQANNILIAGLALQVSHSPSSYPRSQLIQLSRASQTVAFVIFILLLTNCVVRSRRQPLSARLPTALVLLLSLSSFLLLLRTTFRLAESAAGIFSFASTSEGLFGGLEFTPVVLTTWIWLAVPLKKVLPRELGKNEDRMSDMEQRRRLEEGKVESNGELGSL